MKLTRLSIPACVLTLVVSAPARAGMFDDLVETLRFSGFVLDSSHIDVTNSSVAVAANNFAGNQIDLGDFDFALVGPASFVFETGGRQIPEIGLTLSTGLLNVNPNRVVSVGAAQPIAYTFGFDSGTNDTTIVGNLLFDLRAKINTFGSYDFRFEASNRQTTDVTGRFGDFPTGDADFDIGPIDIEGNLFADMLATVTDPFFESAGIENVFALFSGRLMRETQAKSTVDALREKVDGGENLTEQDVATINALRFISGLTGDELPDLEFVERAFPGGLDAVPEPATGLLLAVGMLAFRRRRSR